MKTATQVLYKVLSEDFAGRSMLPHEWDTMPLKKEILKAMEEYATIKIKESYPELIQTLKDLKEVLIEAKLTIHAKGIDVLLKKYE